MYIYIIVSQNLVSFKKSYRQPGATTPNCKQVACDRILDSSDELSWKLWFEKFKVITLKRNRRVRPRWQSI